MSEDVRRLVGRNVRRVRTAAGLSQAKLAELMGVDRAYVILAGWRGERGIRRSSPYGILRRHLVSGWKTLRLSTAGVMEPEENDTG
jgi:hypothetical protein